MGSRTRIRNSKKRNSTPDKRKRPGTRTSIQPRNKNHTGIRNEKTENKWQAYPIEKIQQTENAYILKSQNSHITTVLNTEKHTIQKYENYLEEQIEKIHIIQKQNILQLEETYGLNQKIKTYIYKETYPELQEEFDTIINGTKQDKGKLTEKIFFSEYKEKNRIANHTFEHILTGDQYKDKRLIKSPLTPDFVATNIDNENVDGAIEVKLIANYRLSVNDSLENIRKRIAILINDENIRKKIKEAIKELERYQRELNLDPFLVVLKIYNPYAEEPSFITMILDVKT